MTAMVRTNFSRAKHGCLKTFGLTESLNTGQVSVYSTQAMAVSKERQGQSPCRWT